MNPLKIAMVIGAFLGLKRVCPKCKKVQIVSSDKRQDTMPCKFCGADLPPKTEQRSQCQDGIFKDRVTYSEILPTRKVR
jgi:hypothetical protein